MRCLFSTISIQNIYEDGKGWLSEYMGFTYGKHITHFDPVNGVTNLETNRTEYTF